MRDMMDISNVTSDSRSSYNNGSGIGIGADSTRSITSGPSTIVVMGDALSGKSALIRSLSSGRDQRLIQIDMNSDSGGGSGMKKGLKEIRLLEFHTGFEDSVAPEEVALVIITFDIRIHESFQAAINRWYKIKEERMCESMLFVVGNFIDSPIERRVEIVETCRACAKKDALYFEVSNETMQNVANLSDMIHDLLKDIIVKTESGGKINYWENHEYEKVDLNHIGYHLQNLSERLGDTETDLRHPSTTISKGYNDNDANDRQRIQSKMFDSFRLLGLSIPEAMVTAPLNTTSQTSLNAHHHQMRISLPDGGEDVLLHIYDYYDIEEQIDAFMKIHGISHNRQARDRILSVATMLINEKGTALNSSGVANNRMKAFKFNDCLSSSDNLKDLGGRVDKYR